MLLTSISIRNVLCAMQYELDAPISAVAFLGSCMSLPFRIRTSYVIIIIIIIIRNVPVFLEVTLSQTQLLRQTLTDNEDRCVVVHIL